MTTSQRTLTSRELVGSGPLTVRYDEALAFASEHHRGQLRKGSKVPYLSHLMSVSALTLEHGGSEMTALAALLHDAVEDAADGPAALAEIQRRFGSAVAAIVRSCSDGLDEDGNRSGSWVERKLPYIAHLDQKTPEAALVTAADKTHNARCITDDVRTYGPEFWTVFNACPHQLAWYYASVRAGLVGPLGDSTILPVLADAVDGLIAAAGVGNPAVGGRPAACDCTRG